MKINQIKVSMKLSKEIVDTIKDLAKKQGTTMTALVHKAIGTEKYIDDAISKGSRLLVVNKRGRIREVVWAK